MIELKNGHVVEYNQDFDLFFQNLLESIIKESKKETLNNFSATKESESFNDIYLKELMDNCIYVTHQLFEIGKKNEEFSKFIVTGFIFNSIIMNLQILDKDLDDNSDNSEIIH